VLAIFASACGAKKRTYVSDAEQRRLPTR
jgi:hypothetical protein